MLGWQLFKHAVLMIIRNFGDIVKIGALPIAVAALLIAGIFTSFADGLNLTRGQASGEALLPFLLLFAVSLFCTFWFVVSWHRYVLLEEMPEGWLNGPKPQVKGYIVAIVKLFVVSLVAAVPLFIVAFILSAVPILLVPVMIVGAFIVGYLLFRMSLILPAAAVDSPLSLSEALTETKGNLGTFVTLLLCFFAFGILLQLIVVLTAFIPLIGVLVAIGVQIFSSLLNVSILTTLYGYFIEKRAL